MEASQEVVLRVRELSKSFAGIRALDDVQLDVRRGEVHALMGENGAGKSTLMKILVGLVTPDTGEVWLENQSLAGLSLREIRDRGLSMIHQEMLLVPELTVAQNLFLGRESRLLGWLDNRKLNARAAEVLSRMGLNLDPARKARDLSIAEMQLVEIARAISTDARVIIMDEPTSALSDREVAVLFGLIKDLKARGVAVIYISHKMEEISAIADTVTVLRDGRYIATHPAAELSESKLIALMVGRELGTLFPETVSAAGAEVLSVSGLTRAGAFSDISFAVHAGEVLGMGGLMGAGRTEIARVLYGLDQPDSGGIRFDGQAVRIRTPREAIRLGIGYVGEDRKASGFIPKMSVRENLTLGSLTTHVRKGLVSASSEGEAVTRMIESLKIKASGPEQEVVQLSGGNQQKVVIGKVLLASPRLIILDEPTRGIDIGAKAEIYRLIARLKAEGCAILLISSELPELIGLSDRILILAQGKQKALVPASEASQERLLHYAMPA